MSKTKYFPSAWLAPYLGIIHSKSHLVTVLNYPKCSQNLRNTANVPTKIWFINIKLRLLASVKVFIILKYVWFEVLLFISFIYSLSLDKSRSYRKITQRVFAVILITLWEQEVRGLRWISKKRQRGGRWSGPGWFWLVVDKPRHTLFQVWCSGKLCNPVGACVRSAWIDYTNAHLVILTTVGKVPDFWLLSGTWFFVED